MLRVLYPPRLSDLAFPLSTTRWFCPFNPSRKRPAARTSNCCSSQFRNPSIQPPASAPTIGKRAKKRPTPIGSRVGRSCTPSAGSGSRASHSTGWFARGNWPSSVPSTTSAPARCPFSKLWNPAWKSSRSRWSYRCEPLWQRSAAEGDGLEETATATVGGKEELVLAF